MTISSQTLRAARHKADLTQAELAARLDVSLRTIVNWERDDSEVPAKSEAKVKSVLGATIEKVEDEERLFATFSQIPEQMLDRLEYLSERGSATADLEEIHAAQAKQREFEARVERERGTTGFARKSAILDQFNDSDLLHELSRRARARGQFPTDWSIKAFEQDSRRMQGLKAIVSELGLVTADPQEERGTSRAELRERMLAESSNTSVPTLDDYRREPIDEEFDTEEFREDDHSRDSEEELAFLKRAEKMAAHRGDPNIKPDELPNET